MTLFQWPRVQLPLIKSSNSHRQIKRKFTSSHVIFFPTPTTSTCSEYRLHPVYSTASHYLSVSLVPLVLVFSSFHQSYCTSGYQYSENCSTTSNHLTCNLICSAALISHFTVPPLSAARGNNTALVFRYLALLFPTFPPLISLVLPRPQACWM